MNRLLAAFSPRTTESDTDGCCPQCSPACGARQLRTATRDRALAFRAGRS